ncbi:hypothetical protein [Chachezhania sediminis]|uniref:hypothetical protein n=1 Tax=Chachezhania sediminis TaxID=2599291 RepID=UPI00131C9BE9|nr:hypothetical protein [Chachezhania sediminis]
MMELIKIVTSYAGQRRVVNGYPMQAAALQRMTDLSAERDIYEPTDAAPGGERLLRADRTAAQGSMRSSASGRSPYGLPQLYDQRAAMPMVRLSPRRTVARGAVQIDGP